MSNYYAPRPAVDERPAPLNAAPFAPLPPDGSAVIRMSVNVYEFELPDGRRAAAHVYGPPSAPDGCYASIWESSEEQGTRVWADPRLRAVWGLTGYLRPENTYLDIEPDVAATVIARFTDADSTTRGAAWTFFHEIRERRDGDVTLRLEHSSVDYDSDEIFELFEYGEDGLLRRLAFLTFDQLNAFSTAEENERAVRREAERAAARARGEPDQDDLLPF